MSPIPLEELHRRAKLQGMPRPDTHPDRVLAFLRKHRRQAWRASELARKLHLDDHIVGSVLRRLRARGLVDKLDEHWFALAPDQIAELRMALAITREANERLGPERREDWPSVPHE